MEWWDEHVLDLDSSVFQSIILASPTTSNNTQCLQDVYYIFGSLCMEIQVLSSMLACLPLTIFRISTIISTNFHMGWDIRDGIFVPSTFILLHINTIGYLINIVRYTKSMAGILYVFKGCDILHRQPLNSTMSLGIIFQHIFLLHVLV